MEDQADKEFEPTSQKLERARSDGDAIRSEEAQAGVSLIGFGLSFMIFTSLMIGGIAGDLRALWDYPEQFLLRQQPLRALLVQVNVLTFLPMIVTSIAVLAWLVSTRGLTFSTRKIELKFSKLSLISNMKQKFGVAGLGDFFRRSLKLFAISAVLVLFLIYVADDLYPLIHLSAPQVVSLLWSRMLQFFWIVTGMTLVFGAGDLLWQRMQFLRRNRMSRKDIADEMKESDGDPHMKADRRRRAQEIANNKMLVEVPLADVVIVNPTHYAVALKWDRKAQHAPRVVAKGVDEMAARIRALAEAAQVPIHPDPVTARLLYARLEVGQIIKREHFMAVAAAIRFADAVRQKAKHRPRS